jgi:hypothetical protein
LQCSNPVTTAPSAARSSADFAWSRRLNFLATANGYRLSQRSRRDGNGVPRTAAYRR